MKVLLVNGSPRAKGCTYTALEEMAKVFSTEGIETDIFWIGNKPISGCIACGRCGVLGKCALDDCVNDFFALAENYDGFVFGSPVHYASMSGAMTSFMDRVFYAGSSKFYLKPAAMIASARRAGTTATLDQMNKYALISQMPLIASCYWNMVHGSTPEQVRRDAEGMQVMRTLAKNMAWFLRCKEAGEKNGVALPQQEEKVWTNFIR